MGSAELQTPTGCDAWRTEHGYDIARVHFSSDPSKTPEWAAQRLTEAPSEANYRAEYEIDFQAGAGALMFPEFEAGLNVCDPFPISETWTRDMAIDPHKRRPHAFLWRAISPDGDRWYYREYWPSRIYGQKGKTPEDDKLYHIDDYVAAIKYLEGPEIRHFARGGFADNGGRQERIRARVMDPHGKAIFSTTVAGRDEPETFWDRYERLGVHCVEAKKDVGAGRDRVGMRLRPRKVMYSDGEKRESQIHIFNTLPELILELRTVRWPSLSPSEAERMDPKEAELPKRKHCVDLIRYLEMCEQGYSEPPPRAIAQRARVEAGIGY